MNLLYSQSAISTRTGLVSWVPAVRCDTNKSWCELKPSWRCKQQVVLCRTLCCSEDTAKAVGLNKLSVVVSGSLIWFVCWPWCVGGLARKPETSRLLSVEKSIWSWSLSFHLAGVSPTCQYWICPLRQTRTDSSLPDPSSPWTRTWFVLCARWTESEPSHVSWSVVSAGHKWFLD